VFALIVYFGCEGFNSRQRVLSVMMDLLSLLSSFIGVLLAVCMLLVVSGCGKKKSEQPVKAGAKSGPQKGNGKKPAEKPPAAPAPPAANPVAPTGPTPSAAPPAAAPAAAGDIVDEGGDNYEDVNIGGGEPPPPA
uniref:Uncharacterized protein n=1 Tax=Parascaris univalens TaxID=6257 RepID=A0A915CD43_PARUN